MVVVETVPPGPVQVKVYVLSAVIFDMVMVFPAMTLGPVQLPVLLQEVALETVHVRLIDPLLRTVGCEAVRVTVGTTL